MREDVDVSRSGYAYTFVEKTKVPNDEQRYRSVMSNALSMCRMYCLYTNLGGLIALCALVFVCCFLPCVSHAQTQAAEYQSCQSWATQYHSAPNWQIDHACTLLPSAQTPDGTPAYNFKYEYDGQSPPAVFSEWFYFVDTAVKPVVDQNSGSAGNEGGEGAPCGCNGAAPVAGDPINFSTGNKYLQEDDFVGDRWLTFRRFYNSASPNTLTNAMVSPISSSSGANWSNTFSRTLFINSSASPATISMARSDGSEEVFNSTGTSWVAASPSITDTLTQTTDAQGATIYVAFIAALRHYETYNANGLLQSVVDESGKGITITYSTSATAASVAPIAGLPITVTDSKGRQLNFIYNASFNITQITLPDGGKLNYSYDSVDNLLSVEYPDGKTRQYVYNESSLTGGTSLPNAMTGIIDEAGVRYGSTAYNSSGQATSASFAGGVGMTQITYGSSGTSSIQYPLGTTVTMGWDTTNGHNQTSSISQACGPQCGQPWKTRTYDANSNPSLFTDFNGNVKATTYSSQGLLTQAIEAQGQSTQRTTNITWDTTLLNPLQRTVSNASGTTVSSEAWLYNSMGEPTVHCEIDPTNSADAGYTCSNTGTVPAGVRRSTYTYCTTVGAGCPLVGLMLTATGSRTDLTQTTTYSYYTTSSTTSCGTPGAACYQAGDLHTVTDPAGHVTTIASYDADGRITRMTDANGVNTDLTYTPRGWLASRTVGGAQTSFGYTPYGAVSSVTDPDGVTTTYGYDTAHRLVKITDAQGNYAQYTLDAAGDKTAEQTYDATGTVHKSLSRTFNTLGQLTTVVDGLNHTVFNASASTSYDANGNLVQSTDGLGIQRQLGYDALNRLVQTLDNYNGTN